MTDKLFGYVEVTVAAALLRPDGSFVNGDMADATVAFGLPVPPLDRELTEAESQESIRHNLSRVMAVIEATLIGNGVAHLGSVADPMTAHAREVGRATTDPVTVQLVPREPAHD